MFSFYLENEKNAHFKEQNSKQICKREHIFSRNSYVGRDNPHTPRLPQNFSSFKFLILLMTPHNGTDTANCGVCIVHWILIILTAFQSSHIRLTSRKIYEPNQKSLSEWLSGSLLPRDASAERGDAIVSRLSVRPSVCLSVCLSVTIRYRDHRGWNTSKILSRPNSARSIRSLTPNMGALVQREHPQN